MSWPALAAAISQPLVPTAHLPDATGDPCAIFERKDHSASNARRLPTARDLVQIADIGRSDPNDSPSPFGISPDGRRIAFLVRRGNPEANAYCQQLMAVRMDGRGEAAELNRGGAFIRADFVLRNFPSVRSGYARVITPRWSPDGRSIAFLKRVGGTSQIWLVESSGETSARPATALPDNIDDFAWSPRGDALVVATRPGVRLQAEAIAREARSGFLFDERFSPQLADRPIPVEPAAAKYTRVELSTGEASPASPAEIALLAPTRPARIPQNARGYALGAEGMTAWLEPKWPDRLIGPSRLVVAGPDGMKRSCDSVRCEGIRYLWWSENGQVLHALQKTGWGQSRTALLAWGPEDAAPRQVLATDDVLIGCQPFGHELICAREGATSPRRLVAIGLGTGRERVVYDPNPAFRHLELGKVQRFRFRNVFGVESYADLVLPPHHDPGERHPLVVVQYTSHGFLRGGTGDEVPIQLLAARGFAVLSFARPDFVPSAMEATTELALRKGNRIDWIDRRSVHSSLEIAIDLALATGAVDGRRMGISGFSDGTSTVQWALINSSLFKVAALGACCEDIYSYPLAAGPAFTRFARDMGYHFFEPGTKEYWKPMSLVLNADRIEAPILIQTGDSEYEIGLDVVEAFKRKGKALELYVFEDEPHFKWQPAHRLAMYERVTEWFAFWLMHRINCDPDKADQYRRWKAMKGAPALARLRCDADTLPDP